MTSEELKAAAAVMLAASEGKDIETRNFGKQCWLTMYPSLVSWDWAYSEYRVKQEPEPQKTLGQIAFEAINQRCPWDQALGRINYEISAEAVEKEVLKRQREACTPMRDLPSKPSP